MTARLGVAKTYKLFIDGQFPRSESGRTTSVLDARKRVLAHVSRASRKDLREAVEAARRGFEKWSNATAYNRGQVLYRLAEMMEGKRAELTEAIAAVPGGGRHAGAEVAASIDRVVHYAGWCDKYSQVLGSHNPVAGPHYNFTVPEATGVVAVVAPDEAPLLALVSLAMPVLAAGSTVVAIAGEKNPLVAALLGEACATCDLPAGVLNILTGERGELLPHVSSHREIDAVHGAGLSREQTTLLREGCAENLKRVTIQKGVDWFDDEACESPWWIEPFVEFKTVWHPSSS